MEAPSIISNLIRINAWVMAKAIYHPVMQAKLQSIKTMVESHTQPTTPTSPRNSMKISLWESNRDRRQAFIILICLLIHYRLVYPDPLKNAP